MSVIYLIRHGQASFLQENYDKLSDLGITQSQVLGRAFKERKTSFTKVVRGSMMRHLETAEHCLEAAGQALNVCSDDRWDEYDHMELLTKYDSSFTDFNSIREKIKDQDHPMRALQEILNGSIKDWMTGKHEYKKNWVAFRDGPWNALNSLASELGKNENACVFTSGGPISAIILKLLSLRDDQFIDLQGRLVNSSVTKVLVGKSGLSLSTYNDYSHLEHEPNWITYR